ncbi:RNHCP domain-containing protein [Patescibacteria group bacterium]|nr:RNHCP domain-containing protein [Patescibacteria group bacterium]
MRKKHFISKACKTKGFISKACKTKGFVKKKEDFVCRVCETGVAGTGYTNHCPSCLYSLHVDKDVPGDRVSKCQGLMRPIGLEMKHGENIILHKCQKCGKMAKNKVAENDNFEAVLDLSSSKTNFRGCWIRFNLISCERLTTCGVVYGST